MIESMISKAFAETGELADMIIKSLKRNPMPYDAKIEYLQSSGTQFIDTGIAPFPNLKITITGLFPMQYPSSVFGCRYSGWNSCFGFLSMESDSKIRIDLGTASSWNPVRWEATSKDLTSVTIDAKNKSAQLITTDGQTLSHTYSSATMTFQSEPTIKVFLYDLNNGSSYFGNNMRVSTLQMWDNDVLFRDFISVRKETTGYLYDKISNEMFGNDGTGSFILGQDIF